LKYGSKETTEFYEIYCDALMHICLQKARLRFIIPIFNKKGFSWLHSVTMDHPVVMKIDTPEFKALFSPQLKTLASVFKEWGYELRIAGGAVR
jgi:hypothetical protein